MDFFSGSFAVLEYAPKALVRTVNTKTQQGLPRAERLKNIKNSMTAGPDAKKIAGRVCIVVDDVTTTGATFEEAKRALRQAGARRTSRCAIVIKKRLANP
jgi:predicted amidophosphoribosyltransferase